VINFVLPVFVGGALGAMLREFVMLMVPNLADGFPLDILVANLVAAYLLGVVAALHSRQVVSDDVNMLVGTGLTGGLSTFSSFAYGMAVLTTASTASAVVASAYVVISLVLGYIAVIVGLKLGGQRSA
jgi:fluoride exporter